MRIVRFSYCPYELPLVQPWTTAQGTFTARYGCLVAFQSRRGEIGIGEMAPLVIPDAKTQEDILRTLELLRHTHFWPRLRLDWEGLDEFCSASGVQLERHPDLTFALQCALGGLFAVRFQRHLHHLLVADAPNRVPVNAVIPVGDPDTMFAAAERAVADGYLTLKIKVGVRPVKDDIVLLTILRARYPKLKLRVDANNGWTVREAKKFWREAHDLQLEYVEDPLRVASDSTLEALPHRDGVPIALDQIHLPPGDKLCRFHVIKPARYGTFTALQRLAAEAAKNEIKLVMTGSFESSVGLSYVANLAAAYGVRFTAHGLTTAAWLAEDTMSEPVVPHHGLLRVPDVRQMPKYLLPRYQDELGIAA